MEQDDKVRVFVSYSHKDEAWVREGGPHETLIPWLQRGLARHHVEFWADPCIDAGDDYRACIASQIRNSDIAVLVLSHDFLNSEFIRDNELPLIRERVENRQISVIPILVGHLTWEGYADYRWLSDLQIVPGKLTPLIEFVGDRAQWEKVRVEIFEIILKRVQQILRRPRQDPQPPPPLPPPRRSPWIPWALGTAAALAVAVAVWFFAAGRASQGTAIVLPRDGAEVTSLEEVAGRAVDLDPGDSLWLVVQSPVDHAFFPHPGRLLIRPHDTWVADGVEIGGRDDAGGTFRILLIRVNDEGRLTLEKYATAMERSGLKELPSGTTVLDEIEVRRSGDLHTPAP